MLKITYLFHHNLAFIELRDLDLELSDRRKNEDYFD